MKKISILCAVILAIFAACSNNKDKPTDAVAEANAINERAQEAIENAPPVAKKYQIKSGIITFEETANVGSMKLTSKKIHYFDDYGMKEREDSFDEEGQLKESFMSDGKDLILLMHKDQTAYKRGKAYRGTAYRVDYNEFSQEDKASGKVKKLADEIILGKTCETYTYETESLKGKYAGWGNICLRTEAETSGVKSVAIATSFEEDAVVPADKFTIPSGYAVQ
ncbi:MAG TPA: hypothetical protein VIQ51_03575 [Chryseosolibacter sp.]